MHLEWETKMLFHLSDTLCYSNVCKTPVLDFAKYQVPSINYSIISPRLSASAVDFGFLACMFSRQ